MSTALAPVTAGVPMQMGDDSLFADLAKGVDYAKSLKLYTKGKAIDKGLIAPGRYGVYVSKEEITDLGTSIDLVVWARRPFAIDMSDKENIVRNYDPTSDAFADIRERSKEKNSGRQCGVEFLVFERATGEFYVWFCGSKSTLRAASELYGYMSVDEATAEANGEEPRGPLPVSCGVRLIEGQFSYHVPTLNKCSTPFTNLPEEVVIVEQITKFLNPKTDNVEEADESELAGRAR